MAIAFDSAVAFNSSGTSSVTFSHTISGSNTILFVHGEGSQGPTATLTATYNGVSMTELGHSIDNTGTGVPTYLFYMVNPPTGAHNVVVSSSNVSVSGSSVSYTGVKQTLPISVSNTTALNSTTSSMSKSITTINDKSWVIMAFRTGSGNAITAGSNTVVRVQPDNAVNGGGAFIDSGAAITPAGSATLAVTCTSQYFGGQVIAAFDPQGTDYSMTATTVTFALTVFSAILTKGTAYLLSAVNVSFTISGQAANFILHLYTRVTNRIKHSASVTNKIKHTVSSVTNKIKHTATVTNKPKS